MRLEELWYDAVIKFAILCCFELLLVDVAKFVTDGRRLIAHTLGETFDNSNHLWTKLGEK